MGRQALSFALAAVCVWSSTCFAQSDEDNSLRRGATSLQFLTFGGTSGIFLKKHVSGAVGLRVGANFSLDETSGHSPETALPRSRETRNYSITIQSELEWFVDSRGTVTAFLAAGPYWNKARSMYEESAVYVAYDSTLHTTYSKYEERPWEVGGSVAGGFEWFFRRRLSVIGRVGAQLGFGKVRSDGIFIDNNTVYDSGTFDATTARARTSSAALGLSVYL